MRRKRTMLAAVIAASLFAVVAYPENKNTETITISTYYPAPYGVYKELRTNQLVFTAQDKIPEKPVDGMMFFSNGSAKNEKNELMQKGLWVYMENNWYPLVVSIDPNSADNLNDELKRIINGNSTYKF